MDDSESTNGAQISEKGARLKENETKEKVNKTLLLKQQIEENRIKMLQRGKNISNSKNKLENLFTQLDRSCSASSIISTSLIPTTEIEDARDSKIASLESTVSALKTEKRDLELQILSLETVQENKDCLEMELNELRLRHENVVTEKNMLEIRLQHLHTLEDENDELKVKLDSSITENKALKQDLSEKADTISCMEEQMMELNQSLKDLTDKNSEQSTLIIEELQLRISDLDLANQKLKQECESLQRTDHVKDADTNPVSQASEIKVSTLGANKKSRAKRGKGAQNNELQSASQDSSVLESQMHLLTEQLSALEKDNSALKVNSCSLEEQIKNLQDQLLLNSSEKNTLQQRVEMLVMELSNESADVTNNDLSNLQTLLLEKDSEISQLSLQFKEFQTENEESSRHLAELNSELFKLRTKCRDTDYILSKKEEAILDLQQRLDSQRSVDDEVVRMQSTLSELEAKLVEKDSKIDEYEANFIQQEESTSVVIAQLKGDISDKSKCLTEIERQLSLVTEEKQKLTLEWDDMKAKLNELSTAPAPTATSTSPATSTPATPVKVSTLGVGKKSKSKRGKGNRSNSSEAPAEDKVQPKATSETPVVEVQAQSTEILETRIQSLESQILGLEELLASAEAEKTTLQQRVQLLLAELNTESGDYVTNDVANMQIMLETKEKENAELSSEIHKIQLEKEEMSVHLEEANRELFKLRAAGRDFEYLLNSKEERIQDMQSKLELQNLSSSSMEGEVQHLSKHVTELKLKLTERESELNTSMEEEEKTSGSIVALQEALKKARDDLENIDVEMTDRSKLIQKLEKSCSSLSKENADKNAEIHQLKEDLQEAEVVLAEEITKFKTVQDELNRMKMQAELDTSYSKLETELNHSQVELQILRNDLQTRSSHLEECKQHASQLESQLAQANSKETQLLHTNENNVTQLRSTEEKLERLSEKFKKLAVNYKQKLQIIQQLEQRLEASKKIVDGNSEEPLQVQPLQLRLLESEDAIKSLEQKLNNASQQAEKESEAHQNQLQSANSEIQMFASENRNLLDQLNRLQTEVDQLQLSKLESANTSQELTSMIVRLERELEASQDRLRMLSEKLVEAEAIKDGLDQLVGRLADITEEKENWADELNQVKSELEKANSLVDVRCNELESLHQHFLAEKENLLSLNQSLQDQLSAALTDEQSKKNDISNLEHHYSELLITRESDRARIIQLEAELAAVQNQLSESQSTMNCNSQDLSSLKTRLADQLMEKTSTDGRCQGLEQQVHDLNVQYSGLYASYSSQLHEHSTLETTLAEVTHQRDNLEQRNQEMQVQSLDFTASLAEKDSQLHAASSHISELEQVNESLLKEVETLTSGIQEHEGVHSLLVAAQQELQILQEAASHVSKAAEQDHLASLLSQKESEVEELRQLCNEGLARDRLLLEAQSKIDDNESFLAELRSQLSDMQAENAQMSADMKEIGLLRMSLADMTAEREDLNYQMEDYQAQVQLLEGKVTEAGEVRSILETTVSYLEPKVSELQADITQLNFNKAELETSHADQLVTLSSEREELRFALEEAHQLQKETNNTVNELRQQLEEYDAELTSSRAELQLKITEHKEMDDNYQLKIAEAGHLIAERDVVIQEQLEASKDQIIGLKNFEASIVQWRLEQTHLPISEFQEEPVQFTDYLKYLNEMGTLCDKNKEEVESLRKAMEDLKKQTEELSLLRVNLFDTIAEKDDLESTVSALEDELVSLRSDLKSKVEELNQLAAKFDSGETAQTALNESCSQLNHDKELLFAEVQRLLSVVKDLESGKSELAANLEEMSSTNEQLSAKHSCLTTLQDDLRSELNLLEAQSLERSSDYSVLQERFSQSESELTQLRAAVLELSTERDSFQSERDSLNGRVTDLQELESRYHQLETEFNDVQNVEQSIVYTSLQQKYSESESELSQLRVAILDLSAERDDLQSERDILSDRIANLETLESQYHQLEVAYKEAQNVEQTGVFTSLQEKYSESVSELSQLRVAIFDLSAERDDLESERDSLNDRVIHLETLESRYIQLETENKDLTSDLKNRVADLEKTESRYKDLTNVHFELQNKCTSLENRTSELSTLIHPSDELEAERDDLRNRLEDIDAKYQQLNAEYSEINNKFTQLASVNEDLQRKSTDLENIDIQRQQLQTEYAELNTKFIDLLTVNEDLQGKSAHWETMNVKYQQLSAEYSELNGKITELSTVNQELRRQSEQSDVGNSELSQLRVAFQDVSEECNELQDQVQQADEKLLELTTLRITMSELSMENDEFSAQIQVLEDKLSAMDDMKKQIAALSLEKEQKVGRLSVERDELQQTVHSLQSRVEEFACMSASPSHADGEKGEQETQEKVEQDESLKKKIASLESELHEAKIKVAKSLRQVKLLKAELAKQKEKTSEDYFSSAVEEELRKQVSDAEKVTAEKVKEIERLLLKIDTLEGAGDRFLQSKERQDNEMAMLQQRNRELVSQLSSLEWDNSDTTSGAVEPVAPTQSVSSFDQGNEISELESKLSQLADDNEHYQDVLEELKMEKLAAEAELKQQIQSLEIVLREKSQFLDDLSQSMENKERLLSDAYESVNELRKQIVQLNAQATSDHVCSSSTIMEDLKKENENLVDMIRQLSTTGTLDAATVQRLKEEIIQNGQSFPMNDSDLLEDAIDWQGAFNDIQIEVEYLRSQNASLIHKLQEVGVEWEEGMAAMEDGDDTTVKLQSELDDAIRTIHEREMNCQELTWEIKKLLEERDTLQLRLSNALRMNHEMQQEVKDLSATASGSSPIGDIAVKLRELKQLNYSLDVQLKREQEERQTIERQLMALYGTKVNSPFANSRRPVRNPADSESDRSQTEFHPEQDLSSSQESLGTGQVLNEWLQGKGSAQVHHV